MDTQLVTLDPNNIDDDIIQKAGEIIKSGGLVAFPTETVYGLGGDGLSPDSSRKIYAAKGRPSDNPLIIHIDSFDAIYKISSDVPEKAKILADAFWPGPLTMIVKKSEVVPYETTGGLDTVAVRLPDHEVARRFIRAAGGYVAAPSANTSGRPSPTIARHVMEDMNGRIEMVIDGGAVGIGVESTIVDLTGQTPMILRPGYVTEEMLSRVLGQVDTDATILGGNAVARPKAPGMKYRHYAPSGTMTLIEGNTESVIKAINENVARAKACGQRTGVLCTAEVIDYIEADVKKCVGHRNDEHEIAHNLYRILREFDEQQVSVIYSESFSADGFGQAVMNRLLKAAGFSIIRLEE